MKLSYNVTKIEYFNSQAKHILESRQINKEEQRTQKKSKQHYFSC